MHTFCRIKRRQPLVDSTSVFCHEVSTSIVFVDIGIPFALASFPSFQFGSPASHTCHEIDFLANKFHRLSVERAKRCALSQQSGAEVCAIVRKMERFVEDLSLNNWMEKLPAFVKKRKH